MEGHDHIHQTDYTVRFAKLLSRPLLLPHILIVPLSHTLNKLGKTYNVHPLLAAVSLGTFAPLQYMPLLTNVSIVF